MVHGQLVYFDRDPSLWLTHTIPRASYRLTEPALLAAGMALVIASLATLGFFIPNRPRDAKHDKKGHANISTYFNILARAAIFAALSCLIYTNIPGLLICLSTSPARTLAKPTPSYISVASCLQKSITAIFANFKVLDQRMLFPDQANAIDSPISPRLIKSAQRLVSWLLANDRIATYYPMLMAVSMGHKVALGLLSSAAKARTSLCMTHKAVLLMLILGFAVTVQSVVVFKHIPALKKAALIAPGFATMLGLDMLTSLPSLAFQCAHNGSKWQTATEYAIGAATLEFFLCYAKNFFNLRPCVNILLGDHATGKLDSITTEAVAFGVLLFPCLVASQLHTTINIFGVLYSQIATFRPATIQPSDSQQPIGKEQPIVNLPSSEVSYVSQGPTEEGTQCATTTASTPKSRSDYSTIIRTHPSASYWKLANVFAWISSPTLRYRSIDGWEYTFNDSDLYDVYLLMAKAYKRVLDELLGSVPTTFDPKAIEALVIKYMQEARKQLLHSHPSASGGRGMNNRRSEYRHRQSMKSPGPTRMSTPPLSPSHSDSSDQSEPSTPTEETREAAVQLKAGSRALGNMIKARTANQVNRQVQLQFAQMKFMKALPPVAEVDEQPATEEED